MMTTSSTEGQPREHTISSFELDVYFASPPLEREVAIEEHVATCTQCREYLEDLDRVLLDMPELPKLPKEDPKAPMVPVSTGVNPAEIRGSTWERHRPVGGSRRLKQRLVSAAGVLALAACAVLYLRSRGNKTDNDDDGYVGVKAGAPAAQVLLRRDGQLRVWDGVTAVRPGDAIALDVACEQFEHVTVAAEESNGMLTRAWEGDCPKTPSSPLPFTLVVDEQPGRERFTVVLHRERHLDDEHLRSALRASTRSSDVWTIDFAFAKEER